VDPVYLQKVAVGYNNSGHSTLSYNIIYQLLSDVIYTDDNDTGRVITITMMMMMMMMVVVVVAVHNKQQITTTVLLCVILP